VIKCETIPDESAPEEYTEKLGSDVKLWGKEYVDWKGGGGRGAGSNEGGPTLEIRTTTEREKDKGFPGPRAARNKRTGKKKKEGDLKDECTAWDKGSKGEDIQKSLG